MSAMLLQWHGLVLPKRRSATQNSYVLFKKMADTWEIIKIQLTFGST